MSGNNQPQPPPRDADIEQVLAAGEVVIVLSAVDDHSFEIAVANVLASTMTIQLADEIADGLRNFLLAQVRPQG